MEEEVKGNEEDFSNGIGGAVIRAFYSPIRQKTLKGQSHEKVGEMRVESDSLGPN
jgi:hypothetical protein